MTAPSLEARRSGLVDGVLEFLRCRTPDAWVDSALADLKTLLLDHASLELKAAEQAQKIMRRYGAPDPRAAPLATAVRLELLRRMSRLAREELRHFEQVVELLAARGIEFEPVTPSRYARRLHALVRAAEPGRCVDTLIVGAVIEARSCERFFTLLPALEAAAEPELARFYASLLRAEARHFEGYLALARGIAGAAADERIERVLRRDAELVTHADTQTRFHSGPPRRD